jgi:hypothetical protein
MRARKAHLGVLVTRRRGGEVEAWWPDRRFGALGWPTGWMVETAAARLDRVGDKGMGRHNLREVCGWRGVSRSGGESI